MMIVLACLKYLNLNAPGLTVISMYSCVPNRRAGPNKRAGEKILQKH